MRNLFNHTLVFIIFSICLSCRANDQTTYYISSSQDSDNNQGTINQPFQTLDKINSILLAPGDEVLFTKVNRFPGHFVVNGSGSESQPILISLYGEGSQPVLSGQVGEAADGDYEEAIFVHIICLLPHKVKPEFISIRGITAKNKCTPGEEIKLTNMYLI